MGLYREERLLIERRPPIASFIANTDRLNKDASS